MALGRLIRVRNYRGDPAAIMYVVATSELDAAIELLKNALSTPNLDYEDLGRVNDSLIQALKLKHGEFYRL